MMMVMNVVVIVCSGGQCDVRRVVTRDLPAGVTSTGRVRQARICVSALIPAGLPVQGTSHRIGGGWRWHHRLVVRLVGCASGKVESTNGHGNGSSIMLDVSIVMLSMRMVPVSRGRPRTSLELSQLAAWSHACALAVETMDKDRCQQ